MVCGEKRFKTASQLLSPGSQFLGSTKARCHLCLQVQEWDLHRRCWDLVLLGSLQCVCVLGAGRGTHCRNAARDLAGGTPPSQASKPFFKDLTQEHVFIDLGEEGRGEGEKH